MTNEDLHAEERSGSDGEDRSGDGDANAEKPNGPDCEDPPDESGSSPGSFGRWIGKVGPPSLIGVLLLIQVLFGSWIVVRAVDVFSEPAEFRQDLDLFPPLRGLSPDDDTVLVLLVIGAGLVGSFIHAATSFVSYMGNRTFRSSWTLWYLFRGLIGVALALFVYLVFRGGLLAGGAAAESINVFGVAALSGLAGLFSKQAVDKLEEVFETTFQTSKGDSRKDKLQPVLEITAVQPEKLEVGKANQTVTLTVAGVKPDARVKIDDTVVDASSIEDDEVVVGFDAGQVATERVLNVRVVPTEGPPSRKVPIPVVRPPDENEPSSAEGGQ